MRGPSDGLGGPFPREGHFTIRTQSEISRASPTKKGPSKELRGILVSGSTALLKEFLIFGTNDINRRSMKPFLYGYTTWGPGRSLLPGQV